MICPYCKQDRYKNMDAVRKLCSEHGLIDEIVNPGGRLLIFKGGRSLQIGDQCNACDELEIRKFLVDGTTANV